VLETNIYSVAISFNSLFFKSLKEIPIAFLLFEVVVANFSEASVAFSTRVFL